MRLTQLQPHWLLRQDDTRFRREKAWVLKPNEADGIIFLCPKCFKQNHGSKGTHAVICWRPHVPQTTAPTPGRWGFEGEKMQSLTLVNGSSSVSLTGPGCGAHFWIRNGEIVDA